MSQRQPTKDEQESKATAEALAFEQVIAAKAAEIRGDAVVLTRDLFLKLWPLLREPIPAGFLSTVPKQTGKPYDSTGVRSVQVQISRMDNVLTPLGWEHGVQYENDGKLAHVTVYVIDGNGEKLFSRDSWGGVDRGSTQGNIYKGSYTNAAKPAFARVGPGWEVYAGATDLDPDVSEQVAKASAKAERQTASNPRPLTDEEKAKVVKAIEDAGNDEPALMMILAAVGAESTDDLDTAQAFEIRKLLDEAKS